MKADKKPANVRLPDELHAALRKETAPYHERGEKAPAFGDLLLHAWRQYKLTQGKTDSTPQYPDCSDFETKLTVREPPMYSKNHVNLDIHRDIAPWLPSFITVMTGPAQQALEANISTFAEYTALKGGPNAPPPGKHFEGATQAEMQEALRAQLRAIEKHLAARHHSPRKGDKTA